MNRVLGWVCGVVLLVACGSSSRQPPVKLDEQKARVRTVYSIDLDALLDDKAAALKVDLEQMFADRKIAAVVTTSATKPGGVIVAPATASSVSAIADIVGAEYADTVASVPCDASGPVGLCFALSAGHASAVRKAALGQAISVIQARLAARGVAGATVAASDEQIVIELPGMAPDEMSEVKGLIARTGTLQFKVVDDGAPFMLKLFRQVGADGKAGDPTDPAAIDNGVRADIDQWHPEDHSAAIHTDYYLRAADRTQSLPLEVARKLRCGRLDATAPSVLCELPGRHAIQLYLDQLATADPSFRVPSDRQIGYELLDLDARGERWWRTYYLERLPALTGAEISDASAAVDPSTKREIVLLTFDRDGTRRFAELTARIVGKKLATVLDQRIMSAPIVLGEIRGGRASITMSGEIAANRAQDAAELATVLKAGALPAPIVEESVEELPAASAR
ncbi:MAG: protein-export rane protein SecD [Myxococcales bacterium]|nr:protein-export rane protein SecD [Myxococcales bacterium]